MVSGSTGVISRISCKQAMKRKYMFMGRLPRDRANAMSLRRGRVRDDESITHLNCSNRFWNTKLHHEYLVLEMRFDPKLALALRTLT